MKKCSKCSVELIVGENISPSQWKRYNYKCKKCHYKYNKQRLQNPQNKAKQKQHLTKHKEQNPDSGKYYVDKAHNKWGSGVYGIFENGKCLYVGESIKLYKRIVEHKTIIKYPEKTYQPKLYKALQQHNHIIFGIIEQCDNHKEREQYYINKLKPLYNG